MKEALTMRMRDPGQDRGARIRRQANYLEITRSSQDGSMNDVRRSGQRSRAPDTDRMQEQGTRHSEDTQNVGVFIIVAAGGRVVKNAES